MDNRLKKQIAEMLSWARATRGLTSDEMAAKLQVTVSYYNAIERGKGLIAMPVWLRACDQFGLPISGALVKLNFSEAA